ncbi:MAG: TonB-dependent receptor [Bacteroidota bacterium]
MKEIFTKVAHRSETFKRWTRKPFSIMNSLYKQIHIGFLVVSYSLLLTPAELNSQNIDTIGIGQHYDIEEISVVGQRTPAFYSQTTRKITVLDEQDIVRLPVYSVNDLLEYIPGVDIRQRSPHGVQSDVQIRGGSFDQVMILLNGINITDPQTGHFNLNLPVELSAIKRIEVLHGTGARVHGANAYKGVINIITEKTGSELSGGYTWGDHKLRHGFISARLHRKRFYNGIQYSVRESDGFTNNTDYNIKNLYYQGGYSNRNFGADIQLGLNNKDYGASNFYSPSFPEQWEEIKTRFISADINYRKTTNHVNFKAYYREHLDHFLLERNNPAFYENFHKTNIYGSHLSYTKSWTGGISNLGVNFRQENILSTRLGNDIDNPEKVENTDSTFYNYGYTRDNLGMFLEHALHLSRWHVTAGAMANYNKDYDDEMAFSPGIDVSYYIVDDLKVYSSANQSIRLPTFTDMFYSDPTNEGTETLDPEKMKGFELGTRFEKGWPNLTTVIELTGYYEIGENVIDWIYQPERNLYKAMNIGELNTYGSEFIASMGFRTPVIYLLKLENIRLSYTYNQIDKSTDGLVSKYSLNNLQHKAGINATHGITKKWHFNWNLAYYDRNGTYLDYNSQTGETITEPFEPYWLVDARIYFDARFLKLFLDVKNVFDTRYTDVSNLIQPGRWISGGFEIAISGNKPPQF